MLLPPESRAPVDWASLRVPLEIKAQIRGLAFTGPTDFRDERVLNLYRSQWEPRVRGFVRDLPTFDQAVTDFESILAAVFS